MVRILIIVTIEKEDRDNSMTRGNFWRMYFDLAIRNPCLSSWLVNKNTSGAHEFTWGQSLVFCVVLCMSLFVFFLLANALSVHRFTAFGYPIWNLLAFLICQPIVFLCNSVITCTTYIFCYGAAATRSWIPYNIIWEFNNEKSHGLPILSQKWYTRGNM